MRTGIGYDIHRLAAGRPLMLGGVEIPYEKGLLGHSDADVLVHALCDALLGAAGRGDIGRHFPDTDPAWKDACSLRLLAESWAMISADFRSVINIDATIFAQQPQLAAYVDAMAEKLAARLGMDAGRINIKATTTEGLGIIGQSEAMAAMCVVLIE